MITAAGGRNPIRSQLGIALEGSTQTQKRIVVDILGSDPSPESCSEFHCNGKRPVIVVSGVKGRRRLPARRSTLGFVTPRTSRGS